MLFEYADGDGRVLTPKVDLFRGAQTQPLPSFFTSSRKLSHGSMKKSLSIFLVLAQGFSFFPLDLAGIRDMFPFVRRQSRSRSPFFPDPPLSSSLCVHFTRKEKSSCYDWTDQIHIREISTKKKSNYLRRGIEIFKF